MNFNRVFDKLIPGLYIMETGFERKCHVAININFNLSYIHTYFFSNNFSALYIQCCVVSFLKRNVGTQVDIVKQASYITNRIRGMFLSLVQGLFFILFRGVPTSSSF